MSDNTATGMVVVFSVTLVFAALIGLTLMFGDGYLAIAEEWLFPGCDDPACHPVQFGRGGGKG